VQELPRPSHGGNLAWAASIAGCSPFAILDFSASINPLGPPQSAIAAIQAHLGDLRDYPDPDYRDLRHALSQFHQLPIEWILPGNGSAELLTWASRELAQLQATHLLTPAFGDYQRALQAFDAHVVTSLFDLQASGRDTQDEVINPVLIQPATAQSGLLLNNPHNPTGRLFSIDAILPLLEQFALVVIDEAFMDFLPPPEQQSLIDLVQNYSHLVILRSLTKFYSLPGLRLGYAIAHPDRLNRWRKWRDPWSVSTLAAAAGVAIVQDTDFQQQTWNWLKPTRTQLARELANLPGLTPLPSAANFLLVHCQSSVTALQIRLLEQQQILIRDCLSFSELGDHYFRVAVRTTEQNQRLLEGLGAVLHDR
jgi:L-threonine-O-3-phosphate decarboxylase